MFKQVPRTMGIIHPRSHSKNVECTWRKRRSLQRASPVNSSFTNRSVNESLSAVDKQRLEFLAGNSLKDSLRSERFKQKSTLQDSVTQKNEQPNNLLSQKDSEDLELHIEKLKAHSKALEQKVLEREKKAKEIARFVTYLKTHTDTEGHRVVEFPENYEEILETAVMAASLPGAETINWVQYYESKKDDEKYQKDMEPIKALDLVLTEAELKLRKENDNHSSVFVTGLKNQFPEKIRKNIENAADGHRGERLSLRDKERLNHLTGELEEEAHIISAEQLEKLREIEETLRELTTHGQ